MDVCTTICGYGICVTKAVRRQGCLLPLGCQITTILTAHVGNDVMAVGNGIATAEGHGVLTANIWAATQNHAFRHSMAVPAIFFDTHVRNMHTGQHVGIKLAMQGKYAF